MNLRRPLLAISALAACGLCACASPQWSYGSWLDHVGEVRPARDALPASQQQALRAAADELHARGDEIRVKLATEKDRVQRMAYLSQLEDVGYKLRPIEEQLRATGVTTPRMLPFAASAHAQGL